jgi:hypothetical protein
MVVTFYKTEAILVRYEQLIYTIKHELLMLVLSHCDLLAALYFDPWSSSKVGSS